MGGRPVDKSGGESPHSRMTYSLWGSRRSGGGSAGRAIGWYAAWVTGGRAGGAL